VAVNDIARVYATSLVEIGQEKNILPQIEEDLELVSSLAADGDDEMMHFLNAPGISKEDKKKFINNVFSGKVSDYVLNFLGVLVENGRQSVIGDVSQAVNDLVDIINNIQRVTVVSQSKLDGPVLEKIVTGLKEIYKKDIVVTEEVDVSILGGIIVKVGDFVIDGSLAKDLNNIKSNLLNSKVRSEVAYED